MGVLDSGTLVCASLLYVLDWCGLMPSRVTMVLQYSYIDLCHAGLIAMKY